MAKAPADQRPQRHQGETAVEQIAERIRATHNLDFRNYKRPTLHRRIERRMAERECTSAAQYLSLLDRDSTEWDALIDSLLIKVGEAMVDAFHNQEVRVLRKATWLANLASELATLKAEYGSKRNQGN